MSVFVVGLNGTRLMPTSERKARLLIKSGKATVFLKRPFTIQLLFELPTPTNVGMGFPCRSTKTSDFTNYGVRHAVVRPVKITGNTSICPSCMM